MKKPVNGTLWLVPSLIGGSAADSLPAGVLERIRSLDYFIAERSKSCRAFLKEIEHPLPQNEITVRQLDKHDPGAGIDDFLRPLREGKEGGLVSEAGLPGILDPGKRVVSAAVKAGLRIRPLTGPSSVMLALMASGLNGQRFYVQGYLPRDRARLRNRLSGLEKQSFKEKCTQIFIETPYRNVQMLEELLRSLRDNTRLCVAAGLTSSEESIHTASIREWKKKAMPEINKVPCVFLFEAA